MELTFLACHDPRARAHAALELLCTDQAQRKGHIFLLTTDGLALCASSESAPCEQVMTEFARGQLQLELDDASHTLTDVTQATLADSHAGICFDSHGRAYFPVALLYSQGADTWVVGVALLQDDGSSRQQVAALASAVARHLGASGDFHPRVAA